LGKISFTFLFVVGLFVSFLDTKSGEELIRFSFFVIICSNLAFIAGIKQPYSVRKMFHLFSLIFFGFAGSVQFVTKSVYFIDYSLPDQAFLKTNIVIFFSIIIYEFTYRVIRLKNRPIKLYKLKRKGAFLLVIISVVASALTFYYYEFNLNELFFREKISLKDSSVSSVLLIDKLTRTIPAVALIIVLLFYNKHKISTILIIGCMLFAFNPLGIPRYATASIYIPILILYTNALTKKDNFLWLYLFSSFFIFPLLNYFRYSTGIGYQDEVTFGISALQSVNFDSYQSLLLTIESGAVTLGRQLLGVVFFMIPRSIWPSKPTGSGGLIAEENDYFYSNVSANFLAEGYLNAGYIGIFIFIVILAILSKHTDKHLLEAKKSFSYLFSLVVLNMSFFVFRGDLMSSFAYLFSYAVQMFLLKQILLFLGLIKPLNVVR
jgi:hypothetical protein